MRNESIHGFLAALADRVPAPGGGASAALHAAQAAALVAMVARYSDGPEYDEHVPEIRHIRDAADELRENALTLVENDAAASTAVTDAYRLRQSDDAARSAAIRTAVLRAARPSAFVIGVATRVMELAEVLLPIGNRQVISDVAAAAEAARAAATTARVNIEINLAGISDPEVRTELLAATDSVDAICDRADKVTSSVRTELAR